MKSIQTGDAVHVQIIEPLDTHIRGAYKVLQIDEHGGLHLTPASLWQVEELAKTVDALRARGEIS